MAKQATVTRSRSVDNEKIVEVKPSTAPKRNGIEIKAEIDDILDEIDAVLEPNAQAYLRSYVQKGGQ